MLPGRRSSLSFRAFLGQLGVVPEAGQLALVYLLDGVSPSQMPPDVRAVALDMVGGVQDVPHLAWSTIVLLAGGRSGKTYLLSLFILYLSLVVDLGHLAPGERGFAAVIAPDLALAQQSINYILGAVESDQVLSRCIEDAHTSEIVLRQSLARDSRLVSVRSFAASRAGSTGRGKSLVALLMSETCFFRDASSGIVNDAAIYRAASPRVVQGGVAILESTPWSPTGLLHELYQSNWRKPSTALVIHAPTTKMRTNAHILDIVRREYERDPDNAAIEYGAQWGTASEADFFTADDLDRLFMPPTQQDPAPGWRLGCAADLGFVRNSSALAILAAPPDSPVWVVCHLEEWRPSKEERLLPSEVCAQIVDRAKAAGCGWISADLHYRETLREYTSAAATRKIGIFDTHPPLERFTALRTMIREGRIRMAPTHPLARRVRSQLATIRVCRGSGGTTSVRIPIAADGSHGDLADVLAEAAASVSSYHPTVIPLVEESSRWTVGEKEQLERLERDSMTYEDIDAQEWWRLARANFGIGLGEEYHGGNHQD